MYGCVHRHHPDYAKNETEILCAKCHKREHKKMGPGKNYHLSTMANRSHRKIKDKVKVNFEMPETVMDCFRAYMRRRGFATITEAFRAHIRVEADKALSGETETKTERESATDGQA
jgi:hypothetical protein